MKKKLLFAALAALAVGLILVPGANAGTEVIQDYGGRDVSRPYNYAPRPPRLVYYPPPPVGIVVYPRIGYYHRPLHFYGYHRPYYYRHRRW